MKIARKSRFKIQLLLNAALLLAIATPIAFGLVHATPNRAQPKSQNKTALARDYKFEVASVKAEKSPTFLNGLPVVHVDPVPDGFTASGVNLLQLISIAYGPPGSLLNSFTVDQLYFQNDSISHAPDWFRTEKFDIDARMESSVVDELQKLSPDDRNLARQRMLQALLADRFKLTVHHETNELPVFALVITKSGPKIHESKPGDADSSGGGRGGPGSFQVKGKGGPVVAQAVPIATLVQFLSRQPLGRTVLDKTGLTGNYDFTLQWTPDDLQGAASTATDYVPPESAWPSLFTALQEQLGLKLEPQKGSVQALVIDHAEKPSGN